MQPWSLSPASDAILYKVGSTTHFASVWPQRFHDSSWYTRPEPSISTIHRMLLLSDPTALPRCHKYALELMFMVLVNTWPLLYLQATVELYPPPPMPYFIEWGHMVVFALVWPQRFHASSWYTGSEPSMPTVHTVLSPSDPAAPPRRYTYSLELTFLVFL